jgi:hypothetical protein
LLTVKGAGVGKTAICDLPGVAISRQLMAMTAVEWSQRFLLLTTHRLAEALKENARSLIPGISREDVNQFIFPLPPLAEQHRIVAKVDELIALCDQLEAQIIVPEADSRYLLEAVLDRAMGTIPYRAREQKSDSTRRGANQQEQRNSSLVPTRSAQNIQFMSTNPVKTITQMIECLTALGGEATPERLLNATGLGDDVDKFFDLLREGRDSGLLSVPTGSDQMVRRIDHAD